MNCRDRGVPAVRCAARRARGSSSCPPPMKWSAALVAAWETADPGHRPAFAAHAVAPARSGWRARLRTTICRSTAAGDRLGTDRDLRGQRRPGRRPRPQRHAGAVSARRHARGRRRRASSGPRSWRSPRPRWRRGCGTPAWPSIVSCSNGSSARGPRAFRSQEKLLAMQGTFAGTAGKVFRQSTDADMKFGGVTDRSRGAGGAFQCHVHHAPARYVAQCAADGVSPVLRAIPARHANTLAATLSGSERAGRLRRAGCGTVQRRRGGPVRRQRADCRRTTS